MQDAFWCNFLKYPAKCRREIFIFDVLTTLRIFHSLSLQENHSCEARESALHFAYFVQRDQHGII